MIKLNFSELKYLELDQCNISSVQDHLSNCSKIWVKRKSFSFGGFSSDTPDMINTRVGNWIIFSTTKAPHQGCGICELHFLSPVSKT
jgi:hypothetical protein